MAIRIQQAEQPELHERSWSERRRGTTQHLDPERQASKVGLELALELVVASEVQEDADGAGDDQGEHHDLKRAKATPPFRCPVPDDRDEGQAEQDERHELRQLFIMLEEDELSDESDASEGEEREDAAADKRERVDRRHSDSGLGGGIRVGRSNALNVCAPGHNFTGP